MEYEIGKFKRDTINRNGKETKTIRVTGLSVNSKFENNEELIIMSKSEFTNLETQINNYEDTIKDLETQVRQLENNTNQFTNQKYYNDLLQAKDDKANLLNTISNRNGLLLSTQEKINEMLDNITVEFSTEIKQANKDIVKQIKAKTDGLKENITVLIDYVRELETLQDKHNYKVDNSSWYNRVFSKDTLKLEIDTGKLKDLDNKLNDINQYCINYEDIVKPVEIPASRISEIKRNSKSNKFDFKELYIDTKDFDDQEENITITPEAVNNRNDN